MVFSDLFVDHMQNHLDCSGLTLKLKALNVSEHSLDQLATDAMLQTRLLQKQPKRTRVATGTRNLSSHLQLSHIINLGYL